jgi:hypothetical protein
MRAALVMAFMFGLSSAAHAQESVLARRIMADAPGAAVVWLPDGISNGMFAWRIAQCAGVPLVFEAVPLDYRDPAVVAQRVDLDGLTLHEALDALVAQDSRYRWEEHDGIIVIRPSALLADPMDALNQRVATLRGNRVRLQDVLARAGAAIKEAGVPPVLADAMDSQEFALDAPSGTVVDLLAAAARAHGGVMWSAPGPARGSDPSGMSIGFRTFAGGVAVMPADAAR